MNRSIKDVLLNRPITKKRFDVELSYGTRSEVESVASCDTWREVALQFWASAAEQQKAYVFAGEWISNVGCFNKEPPEHLRNDVLSLRSELNYCRDCLHHKPNLEGWCGTCGAGY